MADTAATLMAKIRATSTQINELQIEALQHYVNFGGVLHEVQLLFKKGLEPDEHYAEDAKRFGRLGRECQKRALDFRQEMVGWLDQLVTLVSKTSYATFLGEVRVTPPDVIKMRQLRYQRALFEQALTWEADLVEQGFKYKVDELTLDDALKLIRLFKRQRNKKPDLRRMNQSGLFRHLAAECVKASMGNREMADNAFKIGHAANYIRQYDPDNWESIVREKVNLPLEHVKLALLFHDHWPAIKARIDAETAKAAVQDRTYFHPTVKQALRLVGVLPPLPNGGVVGNQSLEFLETGERLTGMPKALISQTMMLHDRWQEIEAQEKPTGPAWFYDLEWLMQELGVLPPS